MTTSSAQDTYSITSSDDVITIDLSNITGYSSSGYPSDTITISNGGSSYTIGSGITNSSWTTTGGSGFTAQTIGSIDPAIFSWKNTEFVDCFPDFDRVKSMCEQYPGLKIIYEKFVTTYNLVKDDYDKPTSEK